MAGRSLLSRVALPLLVAIVAAPAAAAGTVVRTFTFSPADLTVATDDRGYARYSLSRGMPTGEPGAPEVPGLSVLVDLPDGMRAVGVRATAGGFVSVSGGARPRPAQRPVPSAQRPAWTEPDPARYAESGWVSGDAALLGPTGSLRGRSLASLVLLPLQVSPATGAARLATRIEVEIEIGSDAERLSRQRVVTEWEAAIDEAFDGALAGGPAALRQGLDPGRRWTTMAAAQATRGAGPEPQGAGGSPLRPFTPTALPSVLGSPVQYLIITNEAMKSPFQSLADWKTEQGVPAVVRTVEFINQNYPFGVDQADRLRRFIRDAYTQWGSVWVLLGGDTPVIPCRYGRTTFFGGADLATDLYYTDLDREWNADGDSLFGEGYVDVSKPGDNLDFYPDVYVGRAPVQTLAEAQLFVDKQLLYSQNPASGYLCKGLFFAEVLFPQNWRPGDPIASDGAVLAEHAIAWLSGCIQPTRLYENYTEYGALGALPETKRAVVDSINAGYNVLHHVGHGYRNSMSVGDSSLSNPDITPLSNWPRIAGLLYAINCTSAAIDFESIAEEFVLAPNGGACNVVGSTHYDFPATGDGYQNEFFKLVYQTGVTRLGEAHALAKIPFIAFSAIDGVQRWTQMTLVYLGDPQVRLWTQEPPALAVAHPGTISLRDTSVTVSVLRSGVPAQGATVCLYQAGEDYRVGTTGPAGDLTLPFHAESLGTVKVTVTFANSRPYRGTLTVMPTAQVALVSRAQDRVLSDTGGGTVGNGNGILDAGETVNLTLPVRNVGGTSTGTTTATLLSLDPRAGVILNSSSYGTIAPNTTASGSPYRVQVARAGVRDGDEIRLRLSISDGLGGQYLEDHQLAVRAPDLRHLKHVLNDGGAGNGDQFLDIGETADYTVTLVNLTEGVARGVTATLAGLSPGVTVLDGNSAFGDIGALAQVAGDVFRIRNNSDPDPRFTLTVSDAYGQVFAQQINFTAPGVPANVVAIGAATTIDVVWSLSSTADLAGYNIYRSGSQSGPFTKRNFMPGGRIAYYQDGGLAALTRYFYYITAVDSSANESAPSAVISGSTNPPALNGFPIPMGRNTPSSPVVGDLERDGELEVVVGSDFLYAWHADGRGVVDADGSERTSGDFTTQGSYYASAPTITDLDNDGVMDVVALTWESKQLFVFGPTGQVKSGFPISLPIAVWSSPAVGDIDGDGFKEICFNTNSTYFYVIRHNGQEQRDGDGNPGTLGPFAPMAGSDNYGSPALADLDYDGKLDIIAPGRDGYVYAWRWNGTSLPGFPYGPFSAFTGSPAVGDIDLDGKLEIVVPEGSKLHVIEETGASQPGFPLSGLPSTGNSRAPSPALVDMDGDGVHEIVSAGTDGVLRIVRPTGAFYPGWSSVRFTPKVSSATESSPVAADLDGDGHIEILIGGEDAMLCGFRDDGQPLAGFPIRLYGEVRGTPMIWDFNRDGSAEILLAGWDKHMYVWSYPGTYTPQLNREWVMFRHDSERSGRLGPPAVVGVEEVAAQATEPIDGGIRLRWRLPAEARAGYGLWRAFRADGAAAGPAGRLAAVPDGYRPTGSGPVAADAEGSLTVEDRTVLPGRTYSYVLARVESAPGSLPLAFGPYIVQAATQAPERAYLAAAFPNPGRGGQTLAYGLPEGLAPGAVVRLDLYDVRGARVRALVRRAAEPGRFVVAWDGRSDDGRAVPAGVYLYRLTAGPHSLGGRLVRLEP